MASDPSLAQALATGSQLVLGGVFALSALPKLRAPKSFRATLAEYKLLPLSLTQPAAWIVILLEASLAIAFFTGALVGPASLVAILLTAAFMVGVAINLRRGREIDCGCFTTSETISRRTLARLSLIAVTGALLGALLLASEAATAGVLGSISEPSIGLLADAALLALTGLVVAAWVLEGTRVAGIYRFNRREQDQPDFDLDVQQVA